MPRSKPIDSLAGQLAAKRELDQVAPLPEGVSPLTGEELTIYNQITNARALAKLREIDLLLMYDLAKIRVERQHHEETVGREGHVLENASGNKVAHPLCRVIDQLGRRELSIIRSLSLGTHHDQAKTANNGGKKISEIQQKRSKEGNVRSLLA